MDKEVFEERQQILKLRSKILQAEQERISGAKTLSIDEAKRNLWERYDKEKAFHTLERLRKEVPVQLDDEKELAVYREERYSNASVNYSL